MSYTDNYHKYLKYKNKYLKLKSMQKQYGGEQYYEDDNKESIDALHFWGNQLGEHAFMLHLLIVDEELRDQALNHHEKINRYMANTFESLGIDKEKIVLDDNDFNKINVIEFDFQEALQLFEELRDYKKNIKRIIDEGRWIGWVFPIFAKHVLDELNYAYAIIQGQDLNDEDIMHFWNESNAEAAGYSSQMLDPSIENDSIIEKAKDYQIKVMNSLSIEEKDQMIIMSIKYANELDNMISDTKQKIYDNEIKHIIHPALINHLDREDKRCLYDLKRIERLNSSLLR